MRSLIFFKQLSSPKIILLASSPILTLILSMKLRLIALFVIIILDMITGIRKHLFLNGVSSSPFKAAFWKNLKSSGMRQTWRKTYEYGIGIMVFMLLDLYVLKAGTFNILNAERSLSELAIAVACIIEVWSIFENMEAVSGTNVLKKVLNLLPAKFKAAIQSVLSKKK